MRELRFWDTFNGVMTYSRDYKNVLAYFTYRQEIIDGGNSIEDMLSTELPDKNGKMIFQGDVVKAKWYMCNKCKKDKYNEKAIIKFYSNSWCIDMSKFYPLCREGWIEKINSEMDFEIIGNKFSNPELLEGK